VKFGYFTLTDNPPAFGERRQEGNQLIRNVIEQAIEAEQMGFNSAWLPEHHLSLLGVLPSPAMALTYVAAKTSRIKLGPATVVSPLNHPLRLVEEYNLLDLLSDGRAIFSAGRGYDAREYQAFGADFADSRDLFDEQMAYMMEAWRNNPFSFKGKYYDTQVPLELVPSPIQRPHPPVYVACFSKPSVELAARLRINTLFAPFAAAMVFGSVQQAAQESKRMAAEAGNPHQQVMCSYFANVVYSKDEEQKTKERLLYYLTTAAAPAFPDDPSKAPPHIRYFVDIVEKLRTMKTEDIGERSIVTGSPEYCVEVFKKCEAGGIDEIIIYFNFGALGHRETLAAMERFAKDVMPHFTSSDQPAASVTA
jgi:alkanesulfonate monooxygenase SsuD/methylene tetrahydromethanopterin reductase-like flavin-dependent oxidoreductase (luciferase family)